MKRLYRWGVLGGLTMSFLVVSAAMIAACDETYYWFTNFDPSTSYVDGFWIFFLLWCKSIFSLAGIFTLLGVLLSAFYMLGKMLLVKVYHEICYAFYGENCYDEKTGNPISRDFGKHSVHSSCEPHLSLSSDTVFGVGEGDHLPS